jgi:hypothetical protein
MACAALNIGTPYIKRAAAGFPFFILTLSTRTACPFGRRDNARGDLKSVRNGRYMLDIVKGCGAPTWRPRKRARDCRRVGPVSAAGTWNRRKAVG